MEKKKTNVEEAEPEFVSPLRNELITVKFVPKLGKVQDPKHVLYGGKADGAVTTYTVTKLRTGALRNPLTDSEKNFLEEYMHLQKNALSIYGDYWKNYFVRVPKEGITLNLSDPEDYIRYKVLLLNDKRIAPSVQILNNSPKATYEFVLSSDNAEVTLAKTKMQIKKECYKWLGKYEEDYDLLKTIVETLGGRNVSHNTKLGALQVQIGDILEEDPEKFLKVATSPLLATQVIITKGISAGAVAKQGNYYYFKSEGKKLPLCEEGQDPDLRTACKYLNDPKNQTIKFAIEAAIN